VCQVVEYHLCARSSSYHLCARSSSYHLCARSSSYHLCASYAASRWRRLCVSVCICLSAQNLENH